MDNFEALHMASLWTNFNSLADENKNIYFSCDNDNENDIPLFHGDGGGLEKQGHAEEEGGVISLWQAKCLLMRTLGKCVTQKKLVQLLHDQGREESSNNDACANVDDAPDRHGHATTTSSSSSRSSKIAQQVPQLIALERIPSLKHSGPASTASLSPSTSVDVPVPVPVQVQVPAPAAVHVAVVDIVVGPPGYLTKSQFLNVFRRIQAEEGITFSTIVHKIFHCLDSTKRGYVDVHSLTSAAVKACGATVGSKAPMYFSACDEYGIGKISTTQVNQLLQDGATVLTRD